MKLSYAQIVAVLAALFAANVCYHLLGKHVGQAQGPSWFAAGCSDKAEPGAADCAAVLQSPWSYWPPKFPDKPSKAGHIPVAFMGLVYYGILTVWFLGVGSPSRSRRWLHAIPMLLIGAGLAASVMFLYIMFTKLDQWCPWCVVTHALNLLIAICAVLMWPRGKSAGDAPLPKHPSFQLLLVTVIACALVLFGFNKMQAHMNNRRILEMTNNVLNKYIETYQQLTADGRVFMFKWQQSAPTTITLREDDPKRTGATGLEDTFGIVVYSDFGCPMCRKVSERLEKQVQPLFGGNLLIWFKHYPLDTTCNPMTTELKHPHACDAARMAEAARVLKGNIGFWLAHDFLFEHQDEIRPGLFTPERVAAHIGVDAAALRGTMMSAEITQRLLEDVEGARAAGLPGTPGVYINNRRIENFALENMRFWDLMADMYWQARKMDRPAETRLAPPPATPGTPGSSAAP